MTRKIDEITGLLAAPSPLESIEVRVDELLNDPHAMNTVKDWESIGRMIDRADQYGVLIEVIHSFGEARLTGAGVSEAVGAALYEWDV